jgi:multiple sugar transport system permease protein
MAIFLSFTYFNAIEKPRWIGVQNYVTLITRDDIFMKKVLPNTIKYALIVGVGGYVLSFILAWLVAQLTKIPRTIFALILYSPSLTAGVTMTVVWRVLFNGDQQGYLNALLLNLGIIDKPVQWLQSPQHLMDIMILVSLWSSMGVGFLAMLAGILNIDEQLYEAAYIDGIKNRLQEIIYITIPAMKPQMLFGAVMSIVNTFTSAGIGVALSGSNPTPQYAGQLIVNHIEDYGFLRYEMGYAAALSVVLLIIIWFFSRIAWRLFGER